MRNPCDYRIIKCYPVVRLLWWIFNWISVELHALVQTHTHTPSSHPTPHPPSSLRMWRANIPNRKVFDCFCLYSLPCFSSGARPSPYVIYKLWIKSRIHLKLLANEAYSSIMYWFELLLVQRLLLLILLVLVAATYFLFIYSNELCMCAAIFHWISSFKIYFECVETYAFDSSPLFRTYPPSAGSSLRPPVHVSLETLAPASSGAPSIAGAHPFTSTARTPCGCAVHSLQKPWTTANHAYILVCVE